LKARAAGYELDGARAADVAAGGEARADIQLKKVKNLSAHLTNAEWMTSMPGTDEQKRFLLNCNSCHTLERIMKSAYDADGFLQIFQRMAGYYPGSTPLKPQRLAGTAIRDVQRGGDGRKTAGWLASVNLSQQQTWAFPLKTEPRLTGKSTRVIFTEYDLPNPLIQPHDVVLDREGSVWYSDFGQMFLGKMDPKTGKVTQYPIPVVKPGWSEGTLDLDHEGRLWFAEYQGNAIGMFDPKTERISEWKVPTPWSAPYDAVAGRNGEAWTGSMLTDRVSRLDIKSGQYTEYMLPRATNIRRVYLDDSKSPGTLWIGSNHGASIVKVEPLE
jgi:virginiamycin B lyase